MHRGIPPRDSCGAPVFRGVGFGDGRIGGSVRGHQVAPAKNAARGHRVNEVRVGWALGVRARFGHHSETVARFRARPTRIFRIG